MKACTQSSTRCLEYLQAPGIQPSVSILEPKFISRPIKLHYWIPYLFNF